MVDPGIRTSIGLLVLAPLVLDSVGAQTPIFRFPGSAIVSAGPGDLNGDSYPDLLIGGGNKVLVYSGKTGLLMSTLTGDAGGKGFGKAVNGVGDINRDGYLDFVVCAWRDGYVRTFSGKDMKPLFTIRQTPANGLGQGACGIGDVNVDGYPDIAITGPPSSGIYSGKDGKLLVTFQAAGSHVGYGHGVSPAGDVNRDGRPDVLTIDNSPGTALIISGKDGKIIRKLGSGIKAESVALVGDMNKDGYPDHLVGSPGESHIMRGKIGNASVYSGKDGKELYSWWGVDPTQTANDTFGNTVAGPGDLDGDGFPDAIVASMGHSGYPRPVYMQAFSGKTGSVLFGLGVPHSTGPAVGGYVSCLGDINQDGTPDFLASGAKDEVFIMSGKRLDLSSDVHKLSLSRGGTKTLLLHPTGGAPVTSYIVLGSITGTFPGLQLGSINLPLNFDSYTALTLSIPNSAMFSNTIGTLGFGRIATAKVTFPGTLPGSLLGKTIHHGFVLFDGSGITYASNAVPLVFVQ